ncbi:MAG: two-component regulator propeller domain-containing protein, partial [Acidobacteriota bacterium]
MSLAARGRRAVGCAILFAGLAAGVPALEPSSSLAHYGYDVWDSESGLPQNSVTAILQSRDGYLWLGTQEGLVRFDGVNFTTFDTRNTEALGDDYIQAICQTRDGDIWVGTADGLARYRAGVFTRMSFGDSFEGQPVFALRESSDGALWIGSRYGVSRLRGRTLTRFWKLNEPAGGIHAISELPGGEMWFGGRSVLLRYRDGKFSSFGTETGFSGPVYTIIPDGVGGLWVGTDTGLYRFNEGRALAYPLVNATDRSVLSLYSDRSGTLWVGTMAGLFGLRNGQLMQFTSANGLASDQILSILEDREGSLWVGTGDGGLNRLKDQRIANYTTRDGLPDNKIWTVFEDSSRALWVGTWNGILSRMKPGEPGFSPMHDFRGKLTAMAQDSAGALWVGTRGSGLFRMQSGGSWRPVPGIGSWVSSICPVRDGSVWVAVFGGGVVHIDHGKQTKYDRHNGLPGEAAISIFEDRAGDIWIAMYGGGLLRRHDGKFERFTVKDGLPHNGVLSIEQGADGIYWIGTRGGLGRYDGREFTTFRKNEGVFHDSIQRAIDDRHGYLWLTTNRGVSRVSLAELNGFAANPQRRVHPVEFATAKGMRGAECNNTQHGVARSADGRLWFATVKGLAMADPSRIPINRVPPQVVVEQVLASGRPAALAASIDLPAERRDLEIRYTALSFRQPGALRFKYRLEGFDKGWIEAGARRVAYYTNLPPGRYWFHVAASNEDGLWSGSDRKVSFRIAPHFYDTTAFRIGAALFILVGGALALRFHEMRLRRREGLRTELVEAKLDALRAQLRPHFLFNTFNAVLPYIDTEPGRAKRMILQLAELLRASLKSEPGQLVSVDEELAILEQYMSIERARFGDRIQVSVDVDDAVRAARVPSFLLQPLVENAIKHGVKGFSGPVAIRVSVRADGDRLSLTVQDNGRGLPDGREPVLAAGIGISNVRRRLEALYPRRHRFSVHNL